MAIYHCLSPREFALDNGMTIAYCEMEIHLPYAQSLKEKRMVLRKTQDRLRARFNFSIAEVDHQDLWQRAKLAAVAVGSDNASLERAAQQFVREAERILNEMLIDCQVTFMDPDPRIPDPEDP
jgi:uncharacterized protein YlxP (DUF503 family)